MWEEWDSDPDLLLLAKTRSCAPIPGEPRITSRKQGVWVSPTTPPTVRRGLGWYGSVLPVGCQYGRQGHSQLGKTCDGTPIGQFKRVAHAGDARS